MSTVSKKDILSIRDFDSLIEFLSDKLDWPIDLSEVEVDDLAFDYSAKEIGIPEEHVAKVHAIKQLRPLVQGQPWGIFYIDFEPKSLPVTILRRILNAFVQKKRAQSSTRSVWALDDLLFVATHGDKDHRGTTVARFTGANGSTVMREFTWNEQETEFHHLTNYLDKLHWPGDPNDHTSWRSLWQSAFVGSKRKAIQDSKDLAEEMAAFARDIRARIRDHLKVFKSDKEPLRRLYNIFKNVLIHDIDEDGFADMYAQTIAYGLFTARVSHPEGEFDLQRAVEWLPETNPFLKDLFRQCFGLVGLDDERVDIEEVGIGRLIELFQDLSRDDLTRILDEFGSKTGDPVIHFYEGFLEAYDRKIKFQRGVFYTPDPVVSYIVRSVHKLLQDKFGLTLGLADTTTWKEMHEQQGITIPEGVKPETPFVQILDPAAGTGTFLKHTIELIHKTMMDKWTNEGKTDRDKQHLWNEYVPKFLLSRLYGIELMPAPYAVCHMKLGLVLRNTGYEFRGGLRLQVYLANTLEGQTEDNQISLVGQGFERAVADEARAAYAIKREWPILVVMGNPPYSMFGKMNEGKWILDLEADYKKGSDFKKWNRDDYIKFLRFGQWRIDKSMLGILAFISNNGYFTDKTRNGVRKALLSSFDHISVLDLHGSVKRGKLAKTVHNDQNVFDIEQGVGIGIFARVSKNKSTLIDFKEVFGDRQAKYRFLLANDLASTSWSKVKVVSPSFLFKHGEFEYESEYMAGVDISQALAVVGPGIKTERDSISLHMSNDDIHSVVTDFRTLSESELSKKYETEDSRDWKILNAKEDVRRTKDSSCYKRIVYRPFDSRYTWYSGKTRGFIGTPNLPVMRHIIAGSNLVIGTVGNVETDGDWRHVFCSNVLVQHHSVSMKEGNQFFPLYLYAKDGSSRKPNLDAKFVNKFGMNLGLSFMEEGAKWVDAKKATQQFGPEDVFYYIYAIFHSPTYRDRYKEFLKIDYPRVPLTSDVKLFAKLVPLGHELVQYHLLEHPDLAKTQITFPAAGSNLCEKIEYDNQKHRVYIDKKKTQYFEKIPPEVWTFYIGGYQVCEKWLKDRAKAKRTLTPNDILHYRKTVMALSETSRLMKEIDEAIPEWPIK